MPTEGFRCARRPHQRGPSTLRDDAGDRRGVRLQSAGSLVEASKNRGSTNGRPTRRSHSPPSKTTDYGQAAPSPGQYTWRHSRVDGWKPSDGQFGPLPGHVSATSQAPADGRQTVPADLNWSAGQSALLPAQVSATSQSPADARHTVPADWKLSAGQLALLPVQVSAASHGPADARQTVAADFKLSAGQLALLPVQFSAMSHGPADGRQTVAADCKLSAGQVALLPVQFSTASHGPADARQTVVVEASPSAGQSRLVPVHVSATSQTPAEARHTVPAFPGAFSQNFTPPVPVAHVSTVQGLWSLQSASVLQFGGLITQSAGSEFGFWDG